MLKTKQIITFTLGQIHCKIHIYKPTLVTDDRKHSNSGSKKIKFEANTQYK